MRYIQSVAANSSGRCRRTLYRPTFAPIGLYSTSWPTLNLCAISSLCLTRLDSMSIRYRHDLPSRRMDLSGFNVVEIDSGSRVAGCLASTPGTSAIQGCNVRQDLQYRPSDKEPFM